MLLCIWNANRFLRPTGDLLEGTRIESQNLRLQKVRFNLNENIKNAVDDIKSELPNNDGLQLWFDP
jgi:hypothetical protein